MTIKIVTDSISDLPMEMTKSLGITVIPMMVYFGEEEYRDGIDITPKQFYTRLGQSSIYPHTSVPALHVFTDIFDKLAEETDHILMITVSSKLAAVYNESLHALERMKRKCQVEVIDSQWAGMAQGFVVMEAAKAAQRDAGLEETKKIVQETIMRVEFHATFDSLEYLGKGGRIGHAWSMVGSLLKINPVITLKNGIVEPVCKARSRNKAIEHLVDFARSCSNINEMAVEDAASSEEADELVEQLSSIFPKERIFRTKTAPAVGAHTGPSVITVAIQGDLHTR